MRATVHPESAGQLTRCTTFTLAPSFIFLYFGSLACHPSVQITTTAKLKVFDKIFGADHNIGAQTGAILYSAPSFYRDPNCTGFIFGKDQIKGGCAPLDKHIPDFHDYVLSLAGHNPPRPPPLATENLLKNTDGGRAGDSEHPVSVLSGRQPATF